MKTALVTDGKYRSSIAAVRALHRAGYRVVVTQTRADIKSAPAVSVSKSCDDFRWIDGACADADYAEKLLSILKEYEHPVLFCVGAAKIFNASLEDSIIASNANIGGPTTAAGMAISQGWTRLVGPAMLVGVLGYVIGNYAGTLVGIILGAA